MAVSVPKRRSKSSKKAEFQDQKSYPDSILYRIINKIPAGLLLLFIIFLWSFSNTIISGSIVHVCVSSRKLTNLYCVSAGTQPSNYSSVPLPLINNGSTLFLNFTHENVVSSAENPVSFSVSHIDIPSTPASVVRGNSKDMKHSNGSTKRSLDEEVYLSSNLMSSSLFTNPDLMRGVNRARAEELAEGRVEVERQMGVLRSYIAKSSSKPSDFCEGRGIYVYDMPSKFNTDLLGHCNDMRQWLDFCTFLTNNGMGERIPELGKDWYNTHQYALEPIYHNRVLDHPCRVQNMEDAKLFYVPFYGGLDILRWHFKNVSFEVKDSLSKELVEWLKEQKPWKRNLGLDHVFVLGKISWDFRRPEGRTWGTRLLELDGLKNPMKLLIERHPWQINDVGVPHPTYFHPSSDEDIIAWQTKIRGVPRKNLVSFAGAPREDSESIRSILIEQCTSAPNDTCTFFDCSYKACVKPAPIINLFMESEFCLQPVGDSPTRKSVFDSLVAGCIPVVFDPFTAHYQYPWHLPEEHGKYSVYIDQGAVRMLEVNVVEKLVQIPLKKRQEMRKYIIDELMPRLVYSDPTARLDKFEDAFTISMNNLLEKAVNRLP